MSVVSTCPPPGGLSPMARLSAVSKKSRLHLAIVLVGRLRMPAAEVLDLRWPQVGIDTRTLTMSNGPAGLSQPMADLFRWHLARQRLDAWRTPRWPDTGRVFVNACGAPISMETADAVVAKHCAAAGLPEIPLSGLRHPVMRG